MNRDVMLEAVRNAANQEWDIVVIGGGATGLGVAVDAASRGYQTLLLEMADFAKGTSSRSTKLVHGGVRYLAQGDVALVMEALHERGLLRRNAPHLVHNQDFIIPSYSWWANPFYTIGLKVYDMMAGRLGLGPSRRLSREETLQAIPNLSEEGLTGGVIYFDGQFDDARLAINLAQTCAENGGVLLNYCQVKGLLKDSEGSIKGVEAIDQENDQHFKVYAKVVVNATGVFADSILSMDEPGSKPTIRPSQGVHVVLDQKFLRGKSAIMIPRTDDGRVLFAVPWHNRVIVGTTDTPVEAPSLEPRAVEGEVQFILKTAKRYLAEDPTREDVLSVFAGLRPLAAPQSEEESTKEISRNHKVLVSLSGLVSVVGGKWTTYRKMGQDTVDRAAIVGNLAPRPCQTEKMPIHGYVANVRRDDPLSFYGTDIRGIKALIRSHSAWGEMLHPQFPYPRAAVVWAAREEMARTVEDVLARRLRALFLDARASVEMAPEVARLLADELGRDADWQKNQLENYRRLARGYILDSQSKG